MHNDYKIKKSYNTYIELMRIFFTVYIILMHGEYLFRDISARKLFGGGYIGVEFFFIVSGYYIGEKAESQLKITDYLKGRLTRLYPHYFLSIITAIFIKGINNNEDFLDKLRDLFWSMLMLQNMGINVTIHNGPLWYVTHLIYAGTFIYLVLVNNCVGFT